jgi:urease accessory protein UreF
VDIAYIPFVERFHIVFSEVFKHDIIEGRPKLAAWIEVQLKQFSLKLQFPTIAFVYELITNQGHQSELEENLTCSANGNENGPQKMVLKLQQEFLPLPPMSR